MTHYKKPDGGWGWMVVFGCFLVHLFGGGCASVNSMVFVQMREKYKTSAAVTAGVGAVYLGLGFLLSPITTVLAARWSYRAVVMIGGFLMGLGWALSAFAPNIIVAYLTYGVIAGIGFSCSYAPSIVIVNKYFDKKRAIAVGLGCSGVGMGVLILPPLALVLFEKFGFSGGMLVLGGNLFHVCIAGALYRPLKKLKHAEKHLTKAVFPVEGIATPDTQSLMDAPLSNGDLTLNQNGQRNGISLLSLNKSLGNESKEVKTKTEQNSPLISVIDIRRGHAEKAGAPIAEIEDFDDDDYDEDDEDDEAVDPKSDCFSFHCAPVRIKRKRPREPRSPRRRRQFLNFSHCKSLTFHLFNISTALFVALYFTTITLLVALAQEKGSSKLESAVLLIVWGVSDIVPRVFVGFFFDWKPIKPYRRHLYTAALVLDGAIVIMMSVCPDFTSLLGICIIVSAMRGLVMSQIPVIFGDIMGVQAMEEAFGLIVMCQGIMALVGPPLGGILRDSSGTYNVSFQFCGSLGLIGGLVLLLEYFITRWRTKTSATAGAAPIPEAA